jgi:hypothetical protein
MQRVAFRCRCRHAAARRTAATDSLRRSRTTPTAPRSPTVTKVRRLRPCTLPAPPPRRPSIRASTPRRRRFSTTSRCSESAKATSKVSASRLHAPSPLQSSRPASIRSRAAAAQRRRATRRRLAAHRRRRRRPQRRQQRRRQRQQRQRRTSTTRFSRHPANVERLLQQRRRKRRRLARQRPPCLSRVSPS